MGTRLRKKAGNGGDWPLAVEARVVRAAVRGVVDDCGVDSHLGASTAVKVNGVVSSKRDEQPRKVYQTETSLSALAFNRHQHNPACSVVTYRRTS